MRERGRNRGAATARIAALAAAATMAAGLLGCGGGSERQDEGTEGGEYTVEIVRPRFAPVQHLAQTEMMRVGVENTGDETIPNLAITVKLRGPQGQEAGRAFQYRDRQANLALPDRPVWILDLGYPTRAGSGVLGATGTASPRTFEFGEVGPGEVATAVWRLTPVRAGSYRLTYEVAPDIYGVGSIETDSGDPAQGEFEVRVIQAPQHQRVTGDGRVVSVRPGRP